MPINLDLTAVPVGPAAVKNGLNYMGFRPGISGGFMFGEFARTILRKTALYWKWNREFLELSFPLAV